MTFYVLFKYYSLAHKFTRISGYCRVQNDWLQNVVGFFFLQRQKPMISAKCRTNRKYVRNFKGMWNYDWQAVIK